MRYNRPMRAGVRSLKSPLSYQIRLREKVARTIRSKYHLTSGEERKRCGILFDRFLVHFPSIRVIAFSFSSSLEFNKGRERESDGGDVWQSSELLSRSPFHLRSSLPPSSVRISSTASLTNEQEPKILSTNHLTCSDSSPPPPCLHKHHHSYALFQAH